MTGPRERKPRSEAVMMPYEHYIGTLVRMLEREYPDIEFWVIGVDKTPDISGRKLNIAGSPSITTLVESIEAIKNKKNYIRRKSGD